MFGKSESQQGNAGNVRSAVKRGRLALQHTMVGGSCPSASLRVSEEQELVHLLLEIRTSVGYGSYCMPMNQGWYL